MPGAPLVVEWLDHPDDSEPEQEYCRACGDPLVLVVTWDGEEGVWGETTNEERDVRGFDWQEHYRGGGNRHGGIG